MRRRPRRSHAARCPCLADSCDSAATRHVQSESRWIIGLDNWAGGAPIWAWRTLEGERINYLQAEFPHLWPHMEKLIGGKAEYSEEALRQLLGPSWKVAATDLTSIGLFASTTRRGAPSYAIPFLYRKGLDVTRGRA